MSIVVESPDGSPYLTVRSDERMMYIHIHEYDSISTKPIEFCFDKNATEQIIEALKQSLKDTDVNIRTN